MDKWSTKVMQIVFKASVFVVEEWVTIQINVGGRYICFVSIIGVLGRKYRW